MKNILIFFLIFFFFENLAKASNKQNIINKLENIENISFSFIQTINGKDEKGECTIKYPKKIYCEYELRHKKILVSNGTSLVIKKGKQYFRYTIKNTPFELLLDKSFLIKKINTSTLAEVDDKYFFFEIKDKQNNINVFFSKENYEFIGWQIEDIYQNLAVTYIFNTSINKTIDEKMFKLPSFD